MTWLQKLGIILSNDGPWGSSGQGGGNNNNPWSKRPNRGGAPELDAILRHAQNKFKNPFGGGGTGIGLGFIVLVILGLWLATGFYRVQPSENAVVLTFGKLTDTIKMPGLNYHLPWPVQEIETVDMALDRRIVVGWRDNAATRTSDAHMSDNLSEGLMLTGDENIVNIHFVVLWRVNDAGMFLFNIRDPETTIKKSAESAMREIIGRTEIQKALTEARGDIEARARELMQSILDEYATGVTVNSVQLQKVDPPAQVVDAFDDVQRARADKERMRNEGQTYANDILPRARGEAQKTLQDAEGYKKAVISKAEGDAQRFLSVYGAYQQSREVTAQRMYIETMQEILKNSRKIIVGDDKGTPVLPYLSLDKISPAAGK